MDKLLKFFNNDQGEVAKALRKSRAFISMCKTGRRRLNLDDALLAEELTDGAVSVTDFYPKVQSIKK